MKPFRTIPLYIYNISHSQTYTFLIFTCIHSNHFLLTYIIFFFSPFTRPGRVNHPAVSTNHIFFTEPSPGRVSAVHFPSH
ncbi:hypothetical protein HanIR_Chr13g0628961 [Helianthus annuus]|nr:hypothetical protein HanIR_Chr13g0628961 [Helianthus annuus]